MPEQLITAVALYGAKTGAFRIQLEAVQAILSGQLGDQFRPYTLDQIHGTVIRLDGMSDPKTGLIVNQRYLRHDGLARVMDHALALQILTEYLTPPLAIGIGGHQAGLPAAFASRGQHPYERSFSEQGGALVLMGWPAGPDGQPRQSLDALRRKMAEANIAHWYHQSAADVDNDFHLVIGHHQGSTRQQTAAAVRAVRSYLAQHPAQVQVGPGQVSVIASDTPTLAPASFIGRLPLDPAKVASLYHPQPASDRS